ncbi:hypothetical protein MLD38_021198 [Melastoma candidum]|uniref:Uncharacterized protein n=1 Tax=Melastoma candidum TaxID=119954 RepID=A0ACB9QH59_9MYRT|nr:hypothetical protein MLD38_021198 [Melastoma candidum]
MVKPFQDLMMMLNEEEEDAPLVSHVLSDCGMNFVTGPAVEKFGVPLVHLFPVPACSVMAMKHYGLFMEKWLKPLKDKPERGSGILSEERIDWIPVDKNGSSAKNLEKLLARVFA